MRLSPSTRREKTFGSILLSQAPAPSFLRHAGKVFPDPASGEGNFSCPAMRLQRNATFAARPGTKRVVHKPPRQDGRPQHSDRFHGKQSLFTLLLSLWGSFSRFARLCLLKRRLPPGRERRPERPSDQQEGRRRGPFKTAWKKCGSGPSRHELPFSFGIIVFCFITSGRQRVRHRQARLSFREHCILLYHPPNLHFGREKVPFPAREGDFGFFRAACKGRQKIDCYGGQKSGDRKSATALRSAKG